ncbi:M14 family metallopeptidase [Singulisphaera sp. PoT]|uniref:M14 family metallopeptidase n=1 Tax=Singulisphaera sp. PoT TaxID=3411797 RepID=UPI003BF5021A
MLSICAALACLVVGAEPIIPEDLKTVAEKSRYRATARYDDVVALGRNLAASSQLVTLSELGKTWENRSIPLWIVADPPVSTPEQAADSNRLVVLLVGNIHAGEVCGKEALPMLVRELTARPGHPLLKDLILAVVPIYNADGNERVSKDNRPGQHGPEQGMGIRTNARGLDLNRDFMKLEAPESRALVQFLTEWDPALVVDTHTTNGSFHRFILTYEGAKNPAGDERLIRFTRDAMFPELTKAYEAKSGLRTFFYGNFEHDHAEWTSYPGVPRFGTTYVGLRNRLSILTEAYAYASYADRIAATLDFVRCTLEYATRHRAEIQPMLAQARAKTIASGEDPRGDDLVAIRSQPHAFPESVIVPGFVEEQRDGKASPTATPRDYRVSLVQDFRASATVRRPYAYLIPSAHRNVIDTLRAHGIRLERLGDEADLEVERYRVDSSTKSTRLFEGHNTMDVAVTARAQVEHVPSGTIVVRTAQPLGSLAVYLLEPHSDDGLTTWNFFDVALAVGKDFPVLRIPAKRELTTRPFAPAGS